MSRFSESCGSLGCPRWIYDLADGKILNPSGGWSVADHWYPHMPGFVPIIADDSSPLFLGIFRGTWMRQGISFCIYDIESGGKLSEIARTPDQLAFYMIIKSLGEGASQEEAEEFANLLSFVDFNGLYTFALKFGDETKKMHHYFKDNSLLPLEMLSEQANYDGFFDGSINERSGGYRRFYDLMRSGSFVPAWNELNSHGWVVEDAIGALKKLTDEVQDNGFVSQCNSWIEQAEQHLGDRY